MSKQLELKGRVKIAFESENGCQIASSVGIIQATITSCQCAFRASTQLPCRHIFAVRKQKQIPLFSEELVAPRWSLSYLKEVHDNKLTSIHSDTYQVNRV